MEQWLEHSGKSFCELCGYKFEFKPLYDAGAPEVLPWSELFTTVLRIVCFKWLPFGFRALMVVILWLGVAPWCTSWLYRMWLLRASAMVNVNFSERFDPVHVTSDIFSGIILIVCIVFSFLALMSFADFLRFNLDHIDEAIEEDHHHVQQPFQRNNGAELAHGHGAAAAADRNEQDPQLDAPFAQLNGPRRLGNLAAQDSDDSSDEEEWGENARQDNPFLDAFIRHPIGDAMDNILAARPNELRRRRPQDAIAAPGNARNNNNNNNNGDANQPVVEAPLGPRNPRPRAQNANEWDDDFEHMEINIAVDELLGLRGDFVVLFRNVSWLLAFNGAYLGLFAFIPYTLGSTLLSAGGKIITAIPFEALPFAGTFALDTSEDLPIGAFVIKMLQQAVEDAKKNGDCLQLVDLCTCMAGYFSICFTIILWRLMVTTASSYIHRPLMGGLLWALRCLTAIVKVTTLLMLKMVVLPIILGIGIDFATLHLFNSTAQGRIAFCMQNMVGSLMVHWVLGITFMLFVTVSVLQLREVVHPDILAKVIRPQEDHPDLLRTLLSEKCMKHARRMILSLVIYMALLVVLIHVPVRIAASLAPSFFPLTLRFQHLCAEIQVPLELLAVHLVVLGVLEHAKNDIGKFQHIAITFACKHLGLSEHLLPRVNLNARSRNSDRKSDIRVLPPPPLHFHPRAQMPAAQLRIEGHRYLPWPEEGLDDPQPMEYDLLPRRAPSHLNARLVGLLLFCWLVCVTVIGVFVFGTLFVGRVCMGPFERLTGIMHDPLVMAAGVQIVWYIVNGLTALSVLTMPEDQVEASLVERGYCVKNMSPVNAVTGVVGWVFVCPFLVGYLMSACFPDAKSTYMESFWMGYLAFNLFAWLCCFRMKTNRRRRHERRAANEDEHNFADPMDIDDDEHDEHDHDHDEHDHDHDDDDDDDERDDFDEPPQIANGTEAEDFISRIRKSYRQLMFNVTVHENDEIRMRNDNIQDRCFDAEFFQVNVLKPVVMFLGLMVVAPTMLSGILVFFFSSQTSNFEKISFGVSALCIGTVLGLLRSHAHVTRWMSNLCETIRNERYLIGRQLQDMAR